MAANEPQNDVYIEDLPLLARLPDDDLKALAARGRVRRFNAGSTIFHEGDPGDAIYVVVDGRIRMSRLSGSGTEATLALIGPGDCTGELALFDGRPRSATATAMQATRTFIVSREDFLAIWVASCVSAHPPKAKPSAIIEPNPRPNVPRRAGSRIVRVMAYAPSARRSESVPTAVAKNSDRFHFMMTR